MRRPKICVSLIARNPTEAISMSEMAYEQGADLVELRVDLLKEVDSLSSTVKDLALPSILTIRRKEEGGKFVGSEKERIELLLSLADKGFEYVDVELFTPSLEDVIEYMRSIGVKLIISYHDLHSTPSLREMLKVVKLETKLKPEVCKLVTTARKIEDNLLCLRLVSMTSKKTNIVCFAMGKLGVISRVLSPLFGATFTFASLERGKETAEGQLTISELRCIYDMLF